MRTTSGLIVTLAIGCGGTTSTATPAAAPPPVVTPIPLPPVPPPQPPGLRLDTHVRPTHYALDLTIVPTAESFHGKVTIALAVDEPTSTIWLHSDELAIDRVAGGHVLEATPATTDAQLIGIAFDRPVGPGSSELAIEFTGKLSAIESAGLYRQQERGEWYAFTQFESTSARRAFPCFDEPSFKVPFQIMLHVKADHVAASNAPMTGETPEPAGMKAVRFAETKPLPTYLVAFAVGPFDVVDGGTAGRNKVPLRILATKGRAAEAAWATHATPAIIAQLEDYFGMPYPYEKLDQVAVPRKGGAMENAGLVTYGLPLILIPPAEETARRRRGFAGVAAHELAHQWFGDLVTLAWWDDIWLNEAFANWMEEIVLDRWQPTWKVAIDVVQRRSGAMRGDTLATSRRVREPIRTKHDIQAAFDGITYNKGSAVIAMFEHWLGAEKFQSAVRSYLASHAHGVATTTEFLAAVSAAAGSDVAPAFSTFLDQNGTPLVDVELHCDKGARLSLAQQRYAVIGSHDLPARSWQIPICVKYGTGATSARACTLLASPQAELELPGASCPAWVLADEGELGYYRVRYHGDLLDKLLARGALSVAERVGVLGDLAALVDGGQLGIDVALARVQALARDPERALVGIAAGFVGYLGDDVVPPALHANRARFVRKLFGDRARALGWAAKKGEPDEVRLLRPAVLGLVVHTGEDPALIAEAKRLAHAWLADKHAIDPDLVGLVLDTAARNGDRAFFDQLHAAAVAEKERKERQQLLGAMAAFRDPEIVKVAMPIALGDEFDPRESLTLVFGPLGDDATRELAYGFVKEHLGALLVRLPRDSGAGFVGIGGGFCDAGHRADLEAFFKDRAPGYLGGPRALAQTLERLELCIARKPAREAAAATFLARW